MKNRRVAFGRCGMLLVGYGALALPLSRFLILAAFVVFANLVVLVW